MTPWTAIETGNVNFRLPSLVRRVLDSSRSSKNLRFIATPRFPGPAAPRYKYIKNYYKNAACIGHGYGSCVRRGCEMRAALPRPGGLAQSASGHVTSRREVRRGIGAKERRRLQKVLRPSRNRPVIGPDRQFGVDRTPPGPMFDSRRRVR